jgi:hypothetical protein
MLDYISFQLAQVSPENKPLSTIILGSAWAILTHHFQEFPASNPVFWVSIFWAMDWVLGSCVAIKTNNWSPRRSFHGVIKWMLWMAVLTVAWGIRDMNFLGCTLIGGMIEVAIMLTEGSSVMRNCAILSNNPKAQRLLNRFADAADSKLSQIESRLIQIETATNGKK